MNPARSRTVVMLAGLGLLAAVLGIPATAAAATRLIEVGTFEQPVFLTAPPGDRDRLFVVRKSGQIRIVAGGRKRATPFLDLSDKVSVGGEQGLLSMAFSPRYGENRRFYVNYTDRNGDTRIVEYHTKATDRNVAAASSARLVLRIPQPATNHNGGQLQFGPDDLLYIGMGDGGGSGGDRAQNPGSLLGKVLRIRPGKSGTKPYSIPASNPYVGRAGWRPEIYASGLRNPWRFSFDRLTGDLIIADVGQSTWEEIDFLPRGTGRAANFGWPVFEGPARYGAGSVANATFPVLSLNHAAGNCSVVGGYVVRDTALGDLYGKYVYSDFCRGGVSAVTLSPGHATGNHATGLAVSSVVSFGEDGRGRVYVVSLNGKVYRLG